MGSIRTQSSFGWELMLPDSIQSSYCSIKTHWHTFMKKYEEQKCNTDVVRTLLLCFLFVRFTERNVGKQLVWWRTNSPSHLWSKQCPPDPATTPWKLKSYLCFMKWTRQQKETDPNRMLDLDPVQSGSVGLYSKQVVVIGADSPPLMEVWVDTFCLKKPTTLISWKQSHHLHLKHR